MRAFLKKTFLLAVTAALVFLCSAFMAATDESTMVQMSSRDPNTFLDMAQFFKARDISQNDKISVNQALQVEDKLLNDAENGYLPEETKDYMTELDNFKDLGQISDKMDSIAEAFANIISSKRSFSSPDTVETSNENIALSEANETYKSKMLSDPEDVLRTYMHFLISYPCNLDARNNLGLADMHYGYNFSAMMEFMIILKVDSKYEGARLNLALECERLGMTDQAYSLMLQADSDLPGWFDADYNLGLLENQKGNFKAADEDFDRALADIKAVSATKPDLADALTKEVKDSQAINSLDAGKTLSDADKNMLTADLQTGGSANQNSSASSGDMVEAYAPAGYLVFLWIFTALYLILMIRAFRNGRIGGGIWGVIAFMVSLLMSVIASGKSGFTTDSYIIFMVSGVVNLLIILACSGKKKKKPTPGVLTKGGPVR